MGSGSFKLPIKEGSSGEMTYTINTFTNSGTWSKPTGLKFVYALLVSGGGGGKSGRVGAANTNRGGGGATNGSMVLVKISAEDLNSTESVVVGAGGAGAASAIGNDTNGINGISGGMSQFKGYSGTGGNGSLGGTTSLISTGSVNATMNSVSLSRYNIIANFVTSQCIGGSVANTDLHRCLGHVLASISQGVFTGECASCTGGGINSSNVQVNGKGTAGYYNADMILTDELSNTTEGANGAVPNSSVTFGIFLNKIFHWFDPADLTVEMGRPGSGGGAGNIAGTVNGGNGADATGYGMAGGGGGAATNGANSGAGGNGSQGIVIVINIL